MNATTSDENVACWWVSFVCLVVVLAINCINLIYVREAKEDIAYIRLRIEHELMEMRRSAAIITQS
jgi:hypothetical protein